MELLDVIDAPVGILRSILGDINSHEVRRHYNSVLEASHGALVLVSEFRELGVKRIASLLLGFVCNKDCAQIQDQETVPGPASGLMK